MTKEQFSRSKACATKTLYAVMKEMSQRDDLEIHTLKKM